MKITIIGAGYVGLTTAAVLAELGHTVCCVDRDAHKIKQLTSGHVPIYEPGLHELIEKNQSSLFFTTSLAEGATFPVIIICVGTPSLPDGSTDLRFLQSALDQLAPHIHSHKTIIIKSTVPPGTNEWVYETLIEKGVPPHLFHIVSNPEFLREGSAISDMLNADKIVVGLRNDDDQSLEVMKTMYTGISAPYIVTSLTGAEMIKYASNAFLAMKISFINEIARICDAFSVNVNDVAKGIGCDPRIGPHFLQAGLGYGGSCFPKDVRSLEQTARRKNIEPLLLQATQRVNESQIDVYLRKLHETVHDLPRQTIAVLGIAFKPNTDDTRESPAERFIRKLSEVGCAIRAYDPKATLSSDMPNVVQTSTIMEALHEADVLVIATDWPEFQQLDWEKVKQRMNGIVVLDARNCLNRTKLEEVGLHYIGVGVG